MGYIVKFNNLTRILNVAVLVTPVVCITNCNRRLDYYCYPAPLTGGGLAVPIGLC